MRDTLRYLTDELFVGLIGESQPSEFGPFSNIDGETQPLDEGSKEWLSIQSLKRILQLLVFTASSADPGLYLYFTLKGSRHKQA